MRRVIVTGAAGFIGFHLTLRLLHENYHVTGIDNMNDYYDVNLKSARLSILQDNTNFLFHKTDLCERDELKDIFTSVNPQVVINLAAQAGVRYSLQNPYAYIDSNISGFINVLENCRHHNIEHLVYASSSSVYGANTNMPFSIHQNVDHPLSLYAASKKANELMAHSYSHLYRIPTTGLRFFTVYGPWGRPDMAMFIFTKAILSGEKIPVFNFGRMQRDFTYIDDIVEGIYRTMIHIPEPKPEWTGDKPDPGTSLAPYRIYNIGNNRPVQLGYLIEILEKELGRKADIELLPMQPGDVPATYADIGDLTYDVGFKPDTSIEAGVHAFVEWYKDYYHQR